MYHDLLWLMGLFLEMESLDTSEDCNRSYRSNRNTDIKTKHHT